MAKVSIFLKSGQTIEFDGQVETATRTTGQQFSQQFTFQPNDGTRIVHLDRELIAAVTEQDEWV